MSPAPAPLLVFQVGPRPFAAEASDVERIGPALAGAEPLLEETSLGRALAARRGLVVRGAGATLAVDLILGLRQPTAADLRPLPPLAARCLGSGAVRGLVLLDGVLTPLLDLPTLVREALGAPPPILGDPHHA